MLTETFNYNIKYYVDECAKNSKFHRDSANGALTLHNFLTITGLVLVGCQGITMTALGVFQTENTSVAIVGGAYALAITLFSRISSNYNYNVLSVLHFNSADDFSELLQNFMLLELESEVKREKYQLLVGRYISVLEKSHLQKICLKEKLPRYCCV